MKKIKKDKKKKVYDFVYKIYFKNKEVVEGSIHNSTLPPEQIFLTNKLTYFNDGVCTYYNENEINYIEIFELVEKIDE